MLAVRVLVRSAIATAGFYAVVSFVLRGAAAFAAN